MQAMQGMMQNPEFMAMAERLGSQMMRVRALYRASDTLGATDRGAPAPRFGLTRAGSASSP